jgi:cysteine desulfurase
MPEDSSPWIDADHNATTACLPEAREAMWSVLTAPPAQPRATGTAPARAAQAMLDAARSDVAALIGAFPDEIVFTSGATEACNLALLGVAERVAGGRRRFLAPATEHKAVLGPLARIAEAGLPVDICPVDGQGRTAWEPPPDLALLAAMLVNNETGLVHDVGAAARAAHAAGGLLFCDATQAAGRMPVSVAGLGCDLLALSAHKCGGPPGVGCLWIRRGVGLSPLLHGGGQERGLRPGSANLPGIAGFAAAARVALRDHAAVAARLAACTAACEDLLRHALPGIRVHASEAPRIPGTTLITHPGVARGWLGRLRRTRASGGAACTAGEPSHVLQALGLDASAASQAIRLSFGRETRVADAVAAAEDVVAAAGR